MRIFYIFWFFFCSGWGYLLATFPNENAPPFLQVAATFPAAFATTLVLIWLEVSRLPNAEEASAPTFRLKPWNRPMGMVLFCRDYLRIRRPMGYWFGLGF